MNAKHSRSPIVSLIATVLAAVLIFPSFLGILPGNAVVSASAATAIPGGYADVREPSTGISVAPALITEVNTKADYTNILTGSPAIAIFNYRVVNGTAKVLFTDGELAPATALSKVKGKVIPAFRINDTTDADSLAAFLKGKDQRDAYVVSSDPSAVNRAYTKWNYIRGVVDYSDRFDYTAEDLRYEALANGARVVILNENASKEDITAIQDNFGCVWLTISGGKTASVAATNKGPYGLITPDRALTESCYQTYYKTNTLVRRTNVIGHRGNPSVAQENTIAGANTAYANGATMVENDIYLVADGTLMVMHDNTIDRTTNGSGKVVNMTSAQLKKYVVDSKAGVIPQPIPSLEDYFKAIKDKEGRKLVVEIKHPNTAFANALSAMIKKYDIMDQIVIIGFSDTNLQAIKNLLPGVPVGYLNRLTFDEAHPTLTVQTVLENLRSYNGVCNPGYSNMGKAMIQEFIYRGVTLWPWTINTQSTFDSLMIKGVGGVTTNYSQWSKTLVENLTVNDQGRVIATTYNGTTTDVSSSAEMVVVEDTLGISYSKGAVKISGNIKNGKASYFFRYKSTTPTGITYYTVTDVMEIGENGDALIGLGDLQKAGEAFAVSTSTPLSSFTPAAEPLVQDQRYLLMSAKYGHIMSYHPIRNASIATTGSIKLDQDGNSAHTYYKSGSTVYLEHSDREAAMWVLRQYKEATGGNQIPDWNKLQVKGSPYFGGNAYYPGIELKKDKYGDDGVTYWSSTGKSNEFRFLCYRSDSTPFKNDADNKSLTDASARPKYIVESFGNSYLIYFRAGSTDYRFIYCDANGNWGVRRYANNVAGCRPVSQVKADFDELKILIYQHNRNASVKKRVAFEGYQTYTVSHQATVSSVLGQIAKNITVFDPDLKNLHIPCSGTEAKVGYYRLAFDRPFDPTTDGTCLVNIIYRAEANTLGASPSDIIVGQVKVVVDGSDASIVPSNNLTVGTAVATTTPAAAYVPVSNSFIQDGRYLLMSAKYGYIMSLNPNINATIPYTGSINLDQDGNASHTYYKNGNTVYLEHGDRDSALWVVRQYREATGTQVPDGQALKTTAGSNFGGTCYYAGIELQKSKYGDDGTTYWYTFGGRNEHTFLCYRSDSSPFKHYLDNKAMTTSALRPKYIMESFGDTYLIYFKSSATDYRFVFCDANGNWSVRRYADNIAGCPPVSQVKADLAELKVRLYQYNRDTSATKNVAFKGAQTYTASKNTAADAILSTIHNNITVYDPDLKNLHIPYHAEAGKVGCYRLAFDGAFDPAVAGTYTVKVIYHSEATALGAAAKDVVIGTVSVVVS